MMMTCKCSQADERCLYGLILCGENMTAEIIGNAYLKSLPQKYKKLTFTFSHFLAKDDSSKMKAIGVVEVIYQDISRLYNWHVRCSVTSERSNSSDFDLKRRWSSLHVFSSSSSQQCHQSPSSSVRTTAAAAWLWRKPTTRTAQWPSTRGLWRRTQHWCSYSSPSFLDSSSSLRSFLSPMSPQMTPQRTQKSSQRTQASSQRTWPAVSIKAFFQFKAMRTIERRLL